MFKTDNRDIQNTADNMIRMISAVVDDKLQDLPYDQTLKGQIVEKIAFAGAVSKHDLSRYRYRISINNVLYLGYNDSIEFEEGDMVYVLFPASDKTNSKKQIVGKCEITKANSVDLKFPEKDIFGYTTPAYTASQAQLADIVIDTIEEISTDNNFNDFIAYCNAGAVNTVRLVATFSNNFTFLSNKKSKDFSYGIDIIITTEKSGVVQEKIVSFDSIYMIGTVYSLVLPTDQSYIFSFDQYGINPLEITDIKFQLYIKGRIYETGSLTLHGLSIQGIEIIETENPQIIFNYPALDRLSAELLYADIDTRVPIYWEALRVSVGRSDTNNAVNDNRWERISNAIGSAIATDTLQPVSKTMVLRCNITTTNYQTLKRECVLITTDDYPYYELELNQYQDTVNAKLYMITEDNRTEINYVTDGEWRFDWFYDGAYVMGSINGSVSLNSLQTFLGTFSYDGSKDLSCIAYKSGKAWATVETKFGLKSSRILKVEYAVSVPNISKMRAAAQGVENLVWSEEYPTDIPQGATLHTRTTYSDGYVAYQSTYQGENGVDGVGIVKQEQKNEIEQVIAYTNSSSAPPAVKPDKDGKVTGYTSGTWPWKTTREKTWLINYYTEGEPEALAPVYSDWGDWELACDNAKDVEAFNALTNKGEFKGHFYGVYVRGEISQPGVYFSTAEAPEDTYYYKTLITDITDADISNDELYVLWDQTSQIVRVDKETEGAIKVLDENSGSKTLKSYLDYYVNASMIQTGSLLVGDQDKPAFMAGFNDGQVKIAGFEVNGNSFFGHLESKKSYLYSITYEFAQQPTSGNPVYQSTPIGLNGGSPILIRRTFNYSNSKKTSVSTVCIDTIGFDSSSKIEDYVIAYSDSSSASQPTGTDNIGGFTKWSKWLPAQSNTLYEFIGVQWRASSDSGFNKLVPTTTDNSYSNKLYNLTNYKSNDGKLYFGLNMNTNHQDVSLIDDSMIQIVFYGGCAYDSPENAFFKVLADGTMKCQALEVNSIYTKGNNLLLDTVTIQLSETQTLTGINMHTPDYDFNSNDQRGFYVGYDGINTPLLKLQGKKVNIEPTTGYLKVQV